MALTKKYLNKYYDDSKYLDYISQLVQEQQDGIHSRMQAMELLNIIHTLHCKSKQIEQDLKDLEEQRRREKRKNAILCAQEVTEGIEERCKEVIGN